MHLWLVWMEGVLKVPNEIVKRPRKRIKMAHISPRAGAECRIGSPLLYLVLECLPIAPTLHDRSPISIR